LPFQSNVKHLEWLGEQRTKAKFTNQLQTHHRYNIHVLLFPSKISKLLFLQNLGIQIWESKKIELGVFYAFKLKAICQIE